MCIIQQHISHVDQTQTFNTNKIEQTLLAQLPKEDRCNSYEETIYLIGM